jgi:hypothetical protein
VEELAMAWRIHCFVSVAALVVACGGGTGPNTSTTGTGGVREGADLFREDPGAAGAREGTGATREPAADSRDKPPASRDVPPGGGNGGGAGGGGGVGCLPCDHTYFCRGTIGQETINSTLEFKTKDGVCQTDKIKIACDGTYTASDGSSKDKWTLANGALLFHYGQDTVTCTLGQTAGHP